MQTKFLLTILFIAFGGGLLWKFTFPFKEKVVDTMQDQFKTLEEGYNRLKGQDSIKRLRQSRDEMTPQQKSILDTYIPKELHSGKLIYNLSQTTLQNGLNMKSIRYSVVKTDKAKEGVDQKLIIDMQFAGSYENFIAWIARIERSDVLLTFESLDMSKAGDGVTGNQLLFTVKLSAYGLKID